MIREKLPDRILLTDGNAGTARQLRRVLESRGLLRGQGKGSVRMMTSGDGERMIPVMQRLFQKGLSIF